MRTTEKQQNQREHLWILSLFSSLKSEKKGMWVVFFLFCGITMAAVSLGSQPRDPSLIWCYLDVHEDHSGWPPVQEPRLWSNITVMLSSKWTRLQVTTAPASGNIQRDNYGGGFAALHDYSIRLGGRHFTLWLSWWSVPFKVFIGADVAGIAPNGSCVKL
jgi:hypothetical protein